MKQGEQGEYAGGSSAYKKKRKKKKKRKGKTYGKYGVEGVDKPSNAGSGESYKRLRKPKLLQHSSTKVPSTRPLAGPPGLAPRVEWSSDSDYSSTSSGAVHRHRMRESMRAIHEQVGELDDHVGKISSQHSKLMRGKQIFAFRLFKREKRVIRAENVYLRDRVTTLETELKEVHENMTRMELEIETYRQTVENLGNQFAETVFTLQAQHEMWLARQEVNEEYNRNILDHYYYLRTVAEKANPAPLPADLIIPTGDSALAFAAAQQSSATPTTPSTSNPTHATPTTPSNPASPAATASSFPSSDQGSFPADSSTSAAAGGEGEGAGEASPFSVPEGMCWVCNQLLNGDATVVKGHTIHRSKKSCLRLLPAKLKDEKAYLASQQASNSVNLTDEVEEAMALIVGDSQASSFPPLTLSTGSAVTGSSGGDSGSGGGGGGGGGGESPRTGSPLRRSGSQSTLRPVSPAQQSPTADRRAETDLNGSAGSVTGLGGDGGSRGSDSGSETGGDGSFGSGDVALRPMTTELGEETGEKRSFRVAGPVVDPNVLMYLKFVATCSPSNVQKTICSGWLGKRKGNATKKKKFSKMFAWNRRFFVQHSDGCGEFLTYYRSDSASAPLWTIPLQGTVLDTQIESKKYLLILSNPLFERQFQFMAYTEQDFDVWRQVLYKAILRADAMNRSESSEDLRRHAALKRVSVDLSSATSPTNTSDDVDTSLLSSPPGSPPEDTALLRTHSEVSIGGGPDFNSSDPDFDDDDDDDDDETPTASTATTTLSNETSPSDGRRVGRMQARSHTVLGRTGRRPLPSTPVASAAAAAVAAGPEKVDDAAEDPVVKEEESSAEQKGGQEEVFREMLSSSQFARPRSNTVGAAPPRKPSTPPAKPPIPSHLRRSTSLLGKKVGSEPAESVAASTPDPVTPTPPEPQPEPEVGAEPAPQPEPEVGAEQEPEPEVGAEQEPEQEVEAEQEPEPEVEAEQEPEQEVEGTPLAGIVGLGFDEFGM